jgi:hypothetical protein
MTAAASLYRRVRASTERASRPDRFRSFAQKRWSRTVVPARRAARGDTECGHQAAYPWWPALGCVKAGPAALKRGDDGHGPAVCLAWTCRIPRVDLGRPRAQEMRAQGRDDTDPGSAVAGRQPAYAFFEGTGPAASSANTSRSRAVTRFPAPTGPARCWPAAQHRDRA